ncbi:unnamed protein product [Auanema sp. JU1783]|nr:unnamed protein product [Auanema sp. JU1783]
MGSVVANMPLLAGRGPPTVVVHGQMYRQIGSLLFGDNSSPRFAQYYILDPDEAADNRLEAFSCDRDVMVYLSSLFLRKNVLAQSYRMMGDVMKEEKDAAAREGRIMPEIRMFFVTSKDMDLRRYNEPTVNEVAIVYVVNDEAETPPTRFITVYGIGQGLQTISEINALCDPLTYPLIHPTGRKGWEPEMIANTTSVSTARVTQREYYAYLLFTRHSFNAIHLCRRLFQQYIIDAYLKIKGSRLRFHRRNQDQYRMETVSGLTEFLDNTNGDDTI